MLRGPVLIFFSKLSLCILVACVHIYQQIADYSWESKNLGIKWNNCNQVAVEEYFGMYVLGAEICLTMLEVAVRWAFSSRRFAKDADEGFYYLSDV